jgi:hypothetical protein
MPLLFGLYILFGLLQIGLALPLIAEKVKPNPLYGFRIRATLENPQIWYAVNKHFGKRMLFSAVGFLISAVGLIFVPGISLDAYTLGCLVIFAILFTIGMIQSMAYLRSLTRN